MPNLSRNALPGRRRRPSILSLYVGLATGVVIGGIAAYAAFRWPTQMNTTPHLSLWLKVAAIVGLVVIGGLAGAALGPVLEVISRHLPAHGAALWPILVIPMGFAVFYGLHGWWLVAVALVSGIAACAAEYEIHPWHHHRGPRAVVTALPSPATAGPAGRTPSRAS